jgi:hypothetical protein
MVPLQAVRKENADFFCPDLAFPSRFVQSRHERCLPVTRFQTYACKTAFNVLNPLR